MAAPDLPSLLDRAAAELAALVRSGEARPTDLVRACLERIERLDPAIGAFQLVRADRALAEAEALERSGDLGTLPLAGVPLAVKDNLDLAGEPTRFGSRATPDTPAARDHEVVRRLRAAGAIVVGKTRVPELCIWATTDGVFGAARNPWNRERTPGGSSGGSAAAVAAGLVPIALGNDGLGSIRVPAAACGVVGVKPGQGVVPAAIGATSWFGLAENGALATTVADAALMLSVLAGRPELRDRDAPERRLRVALSTRAPAVGIAVEREWAAAAEQTGELLARAGHTVERADPPYPARFTPAVFGYWFAGAESDTVGLQRALLEPRNRRHASFAPLARRLGLVRPEQRAGWRRAHEPFFARFDVLVTPGLAAAPVPVDAWSRRGWLANVLSNTRYAPFAAPWNFAGFPALALPTGALNRVGTPLAVQLAAGPGGESLLLGLAAELERLRPWTRHAPA